MKKIFGLVAAGVLLSSTAAFAADAIVYEEPAPAAVYDPVFNWTGLYVGIQGGYAWINADVPGLGDEDFDGGVFGAYAGANWQHGDWVFGIEGDVAYTWTENTYFGVYDAGTDWQGSIRGRVGYAIDRTLIYGTGGLAIANAYIEGPGIDESDTMTGWTVGAGVEHAFTDNLIGRVEYRYTDFGDIGIDGIVDDIDVDQHTLRVGIAYKF